MTGRFDHATRSRFTLTGAHLKTECAKCHVKGKFKPLEFDTCSSGNCHGERQHKGQFKKKSCTDCHDPKALSWKVTGRFDHATSSRFTLTGAHLKTECAKCHVKGKFKPLKHDTCSSSNCHTDRHKGQFKKKSCTDCHDPKALSWKVTGRFDHAASSRFTLTGAHLKTECAKCHVKGKFKPLEFNTCSSSNCHTDRHKGQFKKKSCTDCHDPKALSWKVTGRFEHGRDANFKLEGRHARIRCKRCHEGGTYRSTEKKLLRLPRKKGRAPRQAWQEVRQVPRRLELERVRLRP